jgi:hypothetical protein
MLYLPTHWAIKFLDHREGDPWPRFKIPAPHTYGILAHLTGARQPPSCLQHRHAIGLGPHHSKIASVQDEHSRCSHQATEHDVRVHAQTAWVASLRKSRTSPRKATRSQLQFQIRAHTRKPRITPATPLFGSSKNGASITNPQQSSTFSPAFGQESHPSDKTRHQPRHCVSNQLAQANGRLQPTANPNNHRLSHPPSGRKAHNPDTHLKHRSTHQLASASGHLQPTLQMDQQCLIPAMRHVSLKDSNAFGISCIRNSIRRVSDKATCTVVHPSS